MDPHITTPVTTEIILKLESSKEPQEVVTETWKLPPGAPKWSPLKGSWKAALLAAEMACPALAASCFNGS